MKPDFYHALFRKAPIGLALCRIEDGALLDVNQAYANIIGRSVEETLKLSYWQITPKKYEADEQKQIAVIQERGAYGPYEKEYLHKDGRLVPVRLSGVVVEVEGMKYLWSQVEDLSQDRYRKLFQSAKPALALCRLEDGALVAVNEAYARMLGRNVDEALGLSYWSVTPRKYQAQEMEQLQKLRDKGEYGPYQKEYCHKDGHLFPVYLSGIKIDIDGIDYIWSHVEKGIIVEEAIIKADNPMHDSPFEEPQSCRDELHKPIRE